MINVKTENYWANIRTINAPWKCGKLFFMRAKHYTRDNLEIKKGIDIHEKSLEMADKVFCQIQKITSQTS